MDIGRIDSFLVPSFRPVPQFSFVSCLWHHCHRHRPHRHRPRHCTAAAQTSCSAAAQWSYTHHRSEDPRYPHWPPLMNILHWLAAATDEVPCCWPRSVPPMRQPHPASTASPCLWRLAGLIWHPPRRPCSASNDRSASTATRLRLIWMLIRMFGC
jgi:hypothetical protein